MPAVVVVAAMAATGATAAIGATVGAAIVGSAVSATAATMIGSAIVGAGVSAAQGGDASDILQGALIGGITAGVGSTVSGYVSNALVEAGVDSAIASAAGSASAGATNAALRGGDVGTAALIGGINSFSNAALQEAVNAPSTSGGAPSSSNEVSTSTSSSDTSGGALPTETPTTTTTDSSGALPSGSSSQPTQASSDTTFESAPQSTTDYSVNPNYSLSGSSPGLKAEMEPTVVDGSKPVDYGFDIKDTSQFGATDVTGAGLHESQSPNIKAMRGAQGLTSQDSQGTLSALGYTPYDASPNLGDPNSFINDPDVLGKDVAQTDTSNNFRLPKINFASLLGIGQDQGNQLRTGVSGKPTTDQYGSPELLGGKGLAGESTGDPYYLQHLKQLYSSLTPEMQFALMSNNGNSSTPYGANLASSNMPVQSPLTMAAGGTTDSTKKEESVFPQAVTGVSRGPLVGGGQRRIAQLTPLAQLKQQIGQPRMAKGGLSISHPDIPKDHKPEFITGETGYYASGRGTGQSDDIPAVLRHGDYVMDADTVAALGDGSSKAGAQALEKFRGHLPVKASSGGKVIPAQIADGEYVLPEAFVTALGKGDNARGAKILDGMRKNLREHKRSAPTSKIPPKAKSPLEYIKMGKKG